MATIAQILSEFWPGQVWRIDEDNYATLNWLITNPMAKPTEAAVRARSAEVDVLIASRAQLARQQQALNDSPDYLLKAVEVIIEGMIEIRRVLNDVRSTVVSGAHTGT